MPSFTYNGLTIPFNQVYGKFTFTTDYENALFSCKFLAVAATEDDLITVCNEIEEKFSAWNQDFTLDFGENATEHYSFSHSGNTGFLARPKINSLDSAFSTGLCRPYSFSIDFSLPATLPGYNFRRSANITFSTPHQERRTVLVSGTYTAGDDKSALENYNKRKGNNSDVDSIIQVLDWAIKESEE